MLSLSADGISRYFLEPGFPFPCLLFVFLPFVAGYIIYRIAGKVDIGMASCSEGRWTAYIMAGDITVVF